MTLTFKFVLDRVEINQCAKYQLHADLLYLVQVLNRAVLKYIFRYLFGKYWYL